MEKIKNAFRNFMLRDIRAVEPDKKGYRIGDAVRVYKEKNGYVVRFLKGTEMKDRQNYLDKLEQEGLEYTQGEDFTL